MRLETKEEFAQLLEGPGGARAAVSLLEVIREAIVQQQTDPIEALIKMDRVEVGILKKTVDPVAVALEDWFAIRLGHVD